MSDASVSEALRSDAPLVVVEAPAGCGKTFQAAEYAKWLVERRPQGRALILTHTHAACDVFRTRTSAASSRTHVTTLDGFVTQIAGSYHQSLDLPADVARWAREAGDNGFEALAERVDALLAGSQALRSALVARYPTIVCDEHQDTNAAQHQVVMHLLGAGAQLRVFGDPSQSIYGKDATARVAHRARWQSLIERADHVDALDYPHRWTAGSMELGEWALTARRMLANGDAVDLRRNRPAGLRIIEADNVGNHGQFRLDRESGIVRSLIKGSESLMILTPTNELVAGINGYLGRSVPIWEGHVRNALHSLVRDCAVNIGNAADLAVAFRDFVQRTATGFTAAHGQRLLREVATMAAVPCRGMPAELQAIARCILDSPDHRGVARAIQRLNASIANRGAMRDVKVDFHREFREASRLDQFQDVIEGHAEMIRRRTSVRMTMPHRFISTVHKAKGLEVQNVLLMPCDARGFSGTEYKRCVLYVALTRATHTLTIVASCARPSPLLIL